MQEWNIPQPITQGMQGTLLWWVSAEWIEAHACQYKYMIMYVAACCVYSVEAAVVTGIVRTSACELK